MPSGEVTAMRVYALYTGYIELDRASMASDDVRYVASSHLHFDHCGGNEFFARATFPPGHQSLLIRDGKKPQLVCAADACYTRENMDRDVLPNVLWNPSVMRESLAALRKLRDQAGATVFYGHDPAQWEATPQAPTPVM
jgi:glyoxylase-like metal-dependent hydrolase (beta-lactamase superfamily II)